MTDAPCGGGSCGYAETSESEHGSHEFCDDSPDSPNSPCSIDDNSLSFDDISLGDERYEATGCEACSQEACDVDESNPSISLRSDLSLSISSLAALKMASRDGGGEKIRNCSGLSPAKEAGKLGNGEELDEIPEFVEPDIRDQVQEELESLNLSSQEINKLELELQYARDKYRLIWAEAAAVLRSMQRQAGSSIGKARPYFDLCNSYREANDEVQRAARGYQLALGENERARQMLTAAEGRAGDDPGLLEEINAAIALFSESKVKVERAQINHQVQADNVGKILLEMRALRAKMSKTITRAEPFYRRTEAVDAQVANSLQMVRDLERAVKEAKHRYAGAMKTLENISEQVHARRKHVPSLLERQPGVGAETIGAVRHFEEKSAAAYSHRCHHSDVAEPESGPSSSHAPAEDDPEFDPCLHDPLHEHTCFCLRRGGSGHSSSTDIGDSSHSKLRGSVVHRFGDLGLKETVTALEHSPGASAAAADKSVDEFVSEMWKKQVCEPIRLTKNVAQNETFPILNITSRQF